MTTPTPDSKSYSHTLESALSYLCRSDQANFYAFIINSLERVYAPGMGTFAVTPRGNRYVLLVDPAAMESYSYDDIVAIMEHEVLHIVLNHIPRAMRLRPFFAAATDQLMFFLANNIGMDAAVNEIVLRNHPHMGAEDSTANRYGWVTAERNGLPKGLAYEDYLYRMMSELRNQIDDPKALIEYCLQILRSELDAMSEALGITREQALGLEPIPEDHVPPEAQVPEDSSVLAALTTP